jgi:hypothetical protein
MPGSPGRCSSGMRLGLLMQDISQRVFLRGYSGVCSALKRRSLCHFGDSCAPLVLFETPHRTRSPRPKVSACPLDATSVYWFNARSIQGRRCSSPSLTRFSYNVRVDDILVGIQCRKDPKKELVFEVEDDYPRSASTFHLISSSMDPEASKVILGRYEPGMRCLT